ncbi:MAG: VacJ family lipoprotein [Chakrabartia sp.]
MGVSAAVLAVALAALPAQLAQDVAQTANLPAPSAPVSTPETANVPTLDALPTTPPSVATPDDAPEEIVITAKRRAIAADPLENFNETSFEVIQSVDKAFVGPVAIAYREKIPGPMRKGVRNFLSNIGEPIAFVNFVLQLKIGKAAETVGRFGINSTLGVAGLFDVAKKKPFYLPHRVNGFAYTMGFHGIKSGPYLYLPFIGPTTLRDVTGRLMDLSLLPFTIGAPFNNLFYAVPAGILSSLDDRAEFDDELQRLRTETKDPYAALRAYYLNRRQAEIDALRGRKTTPLLPDPLAAPSEDKPNIAPATDAENKEIGQQEPSPAEKGNEAQSQPQS